MTKGSRQTNSTKTLSEAESKQLLCAYGIPFALETQVNSVQDALDSASSLGFPLVAKLCGEGIAHKTERGLVRLRLKDEAALRLAVEDLLRASRPEDGNVSVLVAQQIQGDRELIVGLHRDDQLGMTVMVGIGGVLAEVIADVSFRITPIQSIDAEEMIDELSAKALLGPFRGSQAIDRSALVKVLCALSDFSRDMPGLVSAELNPLIVTPEGTLIAVDALVEIETSGPESTVDSTKSTAGQAGADPMRLDPLFNPSGVIVAGASTHPGKFGFVALHNILSCGYEGKVFATNRDGGSVLSISCAKSIEDIPGGQADLVVLCTPASANLEILRACAAKGVRSAFVTSAGYGEVDESGQTAEAELATLADQLGIALAGPNGQGLVSTPASLCAQIVGPYPPRGHIGVAGQSGNLVSTFMNLASLSGIGISRAISAGNAASLSVIDYLEYFAVDAETKVGLAYLEGFDEGSDNLNRLSRTATEIPLILITGGTSPDGQRAAASHTGSLAANDKVFSGMCRQMGIVHAKTVEEAYETAATFATQPLPKGPRVAVVTTAGGWGVLTADAISQSSLELVDLPQDLCAAIDEKLPPRWSRSNPIDLAGGETRDSVPEILELVASHPDIDAVIFLGLGIQSNQARLMRDGRFYPDHGIERIVSYHERQDIRYAQATTKVSIETGKPVLVASELAISSPDNPGVKAVRESGRLCYASSHRAVAALNHLWMHARWRQRRSF